MKYHGYVHPAFRAVTSEFLNVLPQDGRSGAALTVYYCSNPVVDIWAGMRDSHGNPWRQDTLALSFSTTKGVASTLLHVLADQGVVDYEKPVSYYWPEFAQAGKNETTVRHLLSHQAGLYNIRSMLDDADQMLDWDHMVKVLEQARPAHRPGAAHGYHGLTYGWLIGEVLARATGKSFSELLQSEIVQPLELDGMYVGLPDDKMDQRAVLSHFPIRSRTLEERESWRKRPPTIRRRVNVQLRNNMFRMMGLDPEEFKGGLAPKGMRHFSFNDEKVLKACIPAANGMFTARSLAKMYALVANGGAINGKRLLSEQRVREMAQVQSRKLDRVVPLPMHWRLGYHRVLTTGPRVPGAFGHFGYGGSGAWCDPTRGLSVAYTVNSRANGSPFGDTRIMRINSSVIRAIERLEGKRSQISNPLSERYFDWLNTW